MYALFVAAKSIVNDTKGASTKDLCQGCHRPFIKDRKKSTCQICLKSHCAQCITVQKGPRRVCVKCSDIRSSTSSTNQPSLQCRSEQRFHVQPHHQPQIDLDFASSYERPTDDTSSSDSLCRPSELSPLATSMSCAVEKSSWEIWSEEDDPAFRDSQSSDMSLDWRGSSTVLLESKMDTKPTNRSMMRPQMNPALKFTADGTLEHRDLHWRLAIPPQVAHG